MNKLHEAQFELLKKTINILDQNKIVYWLAYGSVLGAVRHNGFIPWDDDVDIYINGKDYKKFQSLFINGEIDGIRLDDYKLCDQYPFTFPKLIDASTKLIEKRFEKTGYISGVYIDVFPLFEISKNPVMRRMEYFFQYFCYAVVESHYCDYERYSVWMKIIGKTLKLVPAKKAQELLYKKYMYGFTNNAIILCEPLQFNDDSIHYAKHFRLTKKHKFESIEVNIPGDYEGYLVGQYGDYMELPPIDKRVPIHNFKYVEFSDGTSMGVGVNE